MPAYTDLHELNFEVIDLLRGRHTNNSNYTSRALQCEELEMKIEMKSSPNSARTNSTYHVDVRVS